MENVLIVSVVKHSDKNNNKAYILKNTATQTKCRTFRELYQEAIERCSDAQSEIINIKTIQISKSNSFDDSSIEISDENMVWSICNDLNFKYVQFTIDDGSTATKDASNSKPSGINAFSVLMSSQNELHMPDKPVPLSGKQLTGPQRLYRLINVGYVGISMLVCFGVIYFLIFNCKVALARTPSFHCAWIDWLVIHMHKHKTHTMQLCYKKLASILQRVSKDQKVHILQMKAVHIKSR